MLFIVIMLVTAVLPRHDLAVQPHPEHLAHLVRQHRSQHRYRSRRLNLGRQALLALAQPRNGDTYTRHGRIRHRRDHRWRYETSPCWPHQPTDLVTAMARIRKLAYASTARL
ncbi:hypothetical protein V6U90_33070 [Micromonospora sp. CPCC 206060]